MSDQRHQDADDLIDSIIFKAKDRRKKGFDIDIDSLVESVPASRRSELRGRLKDIAKGEAPAPFRDVGLVESGPQPASSSNEHTGPKMPAGRVDNSYLTASTRLVNLKYHVAGGLGTVYRATDEGLRREVAVKILPEQDGDSEERKRLRRESVKRLQREAEITGQLSHPGVVPVYGEGESFGQWKSPFFVMPFLDEGTLSKAITAYHEDGDKSPLRLRRLLASFIAACRTVDYAHSRGVVHCDIKPANIMLGDYGETYVIDWGLARLVSPSKGGVGGIEPPLDLSDGGSDSSGCTFAYASPEQIRRDSDIGPATDIYSLGATLYALLLNAHPVESEISDRDARHSIVKGRFPSPRERDPYVPRVLDEIVKKAMRLEPAERYESADQLAEDVDAYLSDRPIDWIPESYRDRLHRRIRNEPRMFAAGGMGLIAVLLTMLLGLLFVNSSRAAAAASSRERLALATKLAAHLGAAEIDRRWTILEAEAKDPRLIETLRSTGDDRRAELQDWVNERRSELQERLEFASLNVFDEEGFQVARAPWSETITKNFAYRDYFHGRGFDLAPGVVVPPTDRPILSPVYISESVKKPMVTFAVPIRGVNDGPDPGPVIGRLTMAAEIGKLGLFSALDQGDVPLLIESRDYKVDDLPAVGLVADHPGLRSDSVHLGKRVDSRTVSRLSVPSDQPAWIPDFLDPLDGYQGQAVGTAIHIQGRAPDVSRPGWIVVLYPHE